MDKEYTRFDAKADDNGLYIRYRAADKTTLLYFLLILLALKIKSFWTSTPKSLPD